MIYQVYCDGSTRGNGKDGAVGAWAYAIINSQSNTMSAADRAAVEGTTNQRMELTAAIEGIEHALPLLDKGDLINVYTDSAYLHNCYTQGWYKNWQKNGWKNSKKEPVANKDLWEKLIPYFEKFEVNFHKVKGHADNVWNNYVDDLAQTASSQLKEKIDANNNH
jgi:ribonuclease HI